MKINLKRHMQDKESLKYIQSVLRDQSATKGLAYKLEKVIRFYEEVETDLEIGGESIIELDKPRLEAIEERNKALGFLKMEDDVWVLYLTT